MKKAFVTGGTGFIGVNLIHYLVECGWEVTALHRPTSNLSDLKALPINLVAGDVQDLDSLLDAIGEKCDAVFHVAANTSHWVLKNAQQEKDNVNGARNVVEAALQKNAGRLIHTSSVAAYGIHTGVIDESTPSNAEHAWVGYMRSKWLAEQEVRKGIEKGLDAVFINPCNVIGPYDYQSWSTMIRMIKANKLKGIPPGKGSFCHVRDVVAAHVAAYEKGKCGENYILGGTDATYMEMAEEIARLLGRSQSPKKVPAFVLQTLGWISQCWSYISRKEPDVTPEKVQLVTTNLVADSSKAKRELGYKTVPLAAMLADCYEWMRKSA